MQEEGVSSRSLFTESVFRVVTAKFCLYGRFSSSAVNCKVTESSCKELTWGKKKKKKSTWPSLIIVNMHHSSRAEPVTCNRPVRSAVT